jgi:hypothetical protein
MPTPLVILGVEVTLAEILKVIGIATTAYAVYRTGSEVAEKIEESAKNADETLEKAKEYVRKEMEKIKEELNDNIDKNKEVAILRGLAMGDVKEQREATKTPVATEGRGWVNPKNPLIIAAIKQTIPFRRVIGDVCALANKLPMIQLRRKNKKLKLDEIPKSQADAIKKIAGEAADELGATEALEEFTTVKLKQLVVSRIFEFADGLLEWKSPLKAEACFGKVNGLDGKIDNFTDPVVSGTKLERKGTDVNPFFPPPIWGGSISADIAIPDYRKEPLAKNNVFALIEIKFKGDRPGKTQFEDYDLFARCCAKAKGIKTPPPRTNGQSGVAKGCRISLFRYDEDVALNPNEKDNNQNNQGNNRSIEGNPSKKSGRKK